MSNLNHYSQISHFHTIPLRAIQMYQSKKFIMYKIPVSRIADITIHLFLDKFNIHIYLAIFRSQLGVIKIPYSVQLVMTHFIIKIFQNIFHKGMGIKHDFFLLQLLKFSPNITKLYCLHTQKTRFRSLYDTMFMYLENIFTPKQFLNYTCSY